MRRCVGGVGICFCCYYAEVLAGCVHAGDCPCLEAEVGVASTKIDTQIFVGLEGGVPVTSTAGLD